MTRWFERFVRRAFLAPYSEQQRQLDRMAAQVASLRGALYQVYEEVELAVRALDLLGERVDAARQRVQLRLEATQGEPDTDQPPPLTPQTFTADKRQRESLRRANP